LGGKTFKSGDWISVNGNSGQVQWKGSERETKRESVPASEKEKEQGREKERKRRRERKRERERDRSEPQTRMNFETRGSVFSKLQEFSGSG
jgi:hypothetical protein